jgi:MoxR-like ATPase
MKVFDGRVRCDSTTLHGRLKARNEKYASVSAAIRPRTSKVGIDYLERITVLIDSEGLPFKQVKYSKAGRLYVATVPYETVLDTNSSPYYEGNDAEPVESIGEAMGGNKKKVPYAAPPKYGPEVMGQAEWNKQMAKHRAWVESDKSNEQPGSGSAEMTGEQLMGEIAQTLLENANADLEAQMYGTKQGEYNVYAKPRKDQSKMVRVAERVKADTAELAIAKAQKNLSPSHWVLSEMEARRQRGSTMKKGKDKRRKKFTKSEAAKGGKSKGKGQGTESAKEEFSTVPYTSKDAEQRDLEALLKKSLEQSAQGKSEPEQKQDDIVLHRVTGEPLVGKDADTRIVNTTAKAVRATIVESSKLLFATLKDEIDALQDTVAEQLDRTPDIDEAQVQKIVDAAISKLAPSRIQLVDKKGKVVSEIDEHTHPLFKTVLGLVQKRQPVYLFGPSGSGKTHLAEQCARILGMDFYALSTTMGTSESQLQGWRLPLSGGEFVYIPAEFVKIYEGGGIFLLDEVDRADPNVLSVLNQALANRRLPIPARFEAPMAEMSPDFIIIAAGNTAGTGADRMYSSATRLDEAFLDRFRMGTLKMDYDTGLEQALVGDTPILRRFWQIRHKVNELRLERVVSTRSIIDAHTLELDENTAVERLTATWEPNERQKVGINI